MVKTFLDRQIEIQYNECRAAGKLIPMWGSMDDRLLVKRAKRGDVDAFAELYGKIYEKLYRFAFYMLKNAQDAEDAVSEAVTDAF